MSAIPKSYDSQGSRTVQPLAVNSLLTSGEQVRAAREVMRLEAVALWRISHHMENEISDALKLLFECQGSVIVTGMGKAGLIGQKIAATLASTGTPSHFLHPAEAFHGDLGVCAKVMS